MRGEDFLTIREAAAVLGLSEPAVRRRVERGLIPVYTNPDDLRSRLVKATDIDEFKRPRLLTPAGAEGGSGEVAMSG